MIHTGTLQSPTIKDTMMVAKNFWVEVNLTPLNPALQPFSQKDPGTINLPNKVKTPRQNLPFKLRHISIPVSDTVSSSTILHHLSPVPYQ